jgi:hypothetical protein
MATASEQPIVLLTPREQRAIDNINTVLNGDGSDEESGPGAWADCGEVDVPVLLDAVTRLSKQLATQPAPLADAALATVTELALGQATLDGAISGPYHVRPAGDYDGWVLVSEYDLAKHEDGQSLDFATFSDESTANYAAAACNAMPGLLARLRAAEATLATVGEAIHSQQEKAVADGIAACNAHGEDSEQFTVAAARLMEVQLIGYVMEGGRIDA